MALPGLEQIDEGIANLRPIDELLTRNQCTNWESVLPLVAPHGLLRKEVIQPHLPVRLPCYDFTPIADPTFDSSLPCGLGHWLRVLPTFVV